jgi:hypothetical protein
MFHNNSIYFFVNKKYPDIYYIICFIIPNQPNTQYYKHLDNRTFLFTLNDKSGNNDNLKNEYKPIFDFITPFYISNAYYLFNISIVVK